MIPMTKVDEPIERFIRDCYPGVRIGWMRIGEGPLQRSALMRTDEPFPSLTRELIAPDGRRFKIHMFCDNGFVFLTWGHAAAENRTAARAGRTR
jgi:hypothetical protein